ncbi:hypothetical protein N8I77_008045 [Diaporthe amygdali]|uniref:Gelsolin n=1 Tax=Phomopsis amygdali TaxID=1214568 RepID=A0AAD9SEB6_PHOAM|nr:hypothetical protein N8I77_008045 [Diaporthe amygdali]
MSDEVSNFLRSVEELNHGRHEEEEARSRELEEKLLQQRKERQARREERARSISPQKSSPANTPPPSARHRDSTPQPVEASSPIPDLSAKLQNQIGAAPPLSADAMDLPSPRSVSPTKETVLDLEPNRSSAAYNSPPSSGVPARTPTLSWQRRPQSQGPDRPRSRPLSMVAAENAAARSNTPPAEAVSPSQTPSRDQISQALASKDPAWFRQTADRGATSAAYRKNQVEDDDTVDVASSRSQLPGMSQTTSTETEKDPVRERPLSQASLGRLGSPLLTTDALKLGPPADIQTARDGSSSGQTSPTRPASPTKGMGGFVQSAMMKRTDSVKRWSVTTPGLQRGNTSANRNSMDGKNGATSPGPEPTSRPVSRSRDSTSRPTSSHAKDLAAAAADAISPEDNPSEPSKLELPVDDTPPTSPSKTMDPRRWSPTKGSWLDAALNKPESPKPKPAAPPSNQPAWMVELNRAKAERAKNSSVDLGRAGSTVKKHEVKTGGLVRPAPMGTAVKPPSLTGPMSPSIGGDKPLTPGLRSGVTRSDSVTRISPASEKPGIGTEELGRRNSAISPIAKDKPETPPQSNFRAGLRPRGTTIGKDSGDREPVNELANVFGQLRKTKTQNYVAPDVLKDNITKGKSALNVTGGPRPYEKKDEFKDAILKKKADFKQAKEEGRGIATNQKSPEEKAIPEGLARRATITRSGSSPHGFHSRDPSTAKSPSESSARPFESSRSSVISVTSPRETNVDTAPIKAENKEAMPSPSRPEVSTPGRLQNKFGDSGKTLANRFNPALAGLLARGPPGMGGAGPNVPGASSGPSASSGSEPGPGPKLEHMTKGRARGPRRKAPTSASKPVGADNPETAATPETVITPNVAPTAETTKTPEATIIPDAAPQRTVPLERAVKPASPSPPTLVQEPEPEATASQKSSIKSPVVSPTSTRDSGVISLVDSSKRKLAEQRPVSAGTRIALVDSSQPRVTSPPSPKKIQEQVSALSSKSQVIEEKKEDAPPPSPRKLDVKRMSRFLDEAGPQSPKNEPEPIRSPSSPKKTFGSPASPRKLPFEPEKGDSQSAFPVSNGAPLFNGSASPKKTQPQVDKPVPEPLTLRPRSPTKTHATRDLPSRSSTPAHASPLATPTRSPSKSAGDVSSMIHGFFGNERPKRNYQVDAAEILMNRPKGGSRVQTHKAQLFQVTEQGKKIPVPSHYERVLFEREMYICSHTFTDESRKRISEVYFWVGDEVAPSAVEDAQIFVNREAKSMGGTLIKMRQGKETAEFIQALGGIVITRRGSSNKYDSLASNILCGRQYMGQIVFDEVDFNSSILCSGFPYLITQQGKCYLWKGKGAGVDELSCARLIGMDLALMGELIEMDEGQEPDTFWDFFGGDRKTGLNSADHWRLKPSYEKYCGRLFCSDSAAQKQITEINPFSQLDLSSDRIYVLDAFFEMYVIVGRESQAQYGSFRNALDFAQEYAILAAGMEDRPFVPVSTIVMEGIPRDLRSVFRKWRDDLSPTKMLPPSSGGGSAGGHRSPLKRARSLRILPLTQALQVLGNSE